MGSSLRPLNRLTCRVPRMSNKFYEMIGRVVLGQASRQVRSSFSGKRLRYGAIAVAAVGVTVAGAVLARSHAPAE